MVSTSCSSPKNMGSQCCPWDQVNHFLMDVNLVHKIIQSSKTFTPIIWCEWAQISNFPPYPPWSPQLIYPGWQGHAQDPREAIPWALRDWEPLNPSTQVTHPRATMFAICNLSHLDFFVGEKNVSCIMGFLNSQDVWIWGQGFAPILGGYIDLDLSTL